MPTFTGEIFHELQAYTSILIEGDTNSTGNTVTQGSSVVFLLFDIHLHTQCIYSPIGPEAVGLHDESSNVGAFDESASVSKFDRE